LQVTVEVPVEKIVEKVVVKEVPVEKIVVKEVPLPVERIVVQVKPETPKSPKNNPPLNRALRRLERLQTLNPESLLCRRCP
jgi:hypothetical protein